MSKTNALFVGTLPYPPEYGIGISLYIELFAALPYPPGVRQCRIAAEAAGLVYLLHKTCCKNAIAGL